MRLHCVTSADDLGIMGMTDSLGVTEMAPVAAPRSRVDSETHIP
jgi:hypothetical protein